MTDRIIAASSRGVDSWREAAQANAGDITLRDKRSGSALVEKGNSRIIPQGISSLSGSSQKARTHFIDSMASHHGIDRATVELSLADNGLKKDTPLSSGMVQRVMGDLNSQTTIDDMTERLQHKPLAHKLCSLVSGKAMEYDSRAVVVEHGLMTPPEQCQMIRAAFDSADKLVVATSYSIKPMGKDDQGEPTLATTLVAFLQGCAEKQDDAEFTAALLYQKSSGVANKAVGGKRTQVSIKNNDWQKMVSTYNHLVEQGKVDGQPLTNTNARIFFMAADANGFSGSHHNKYVLNDQGLAVTLGSSIADGTNKANWLDSGVITISDKLAAFQLQHFQDNQAVKASPSPQGKDNHIACVNVSDGDVEQLSAQESAAAFHSHMKPALTNASARMNDRNEGDSQGISEALSRQGFEPGELKQTGVAWVNKMGGDKINQASKQPIGIALNSLMDGANEGDTLYIRNAIKRTYDPAICRSLAEAGSRGVKVKLFASAEPESNPSFINKQVKGIYEGISKQLKGSPESVEQTLSNIELLVSSRSDEYKSMASERGWREEAAKPGILKDHGKFYGKLTPEGSAVVITGSSNLDGQSIQRSHENVQVIDDKDGSLLQGHVGKYYDAAESQAITFAELGEQIRSNSR